LLVLQSLRQETSERSQQDRAHECEHGEDSQDVEFQGKVHKASLRCHEYILSDRATRSKA
jgi:hypothetical protein